VFAFRDNSNSSEPDSSNRFRSINTRYSSSKGPKPYVEHPVCVLAKRYSITWMVVAAVSELMNICSFYNAAAVNSHEAIASERTCVKICGDDGQAKTGFPAAFTRCLIKSGVLLYNSIWWYGQAHKLIQCSTFGEIHEILRDKDATHLCSEFWIIETP
jgi:hypothetical protein